MKTRTILAIIAFFCSTYARAQQTILYPALKKQIDSLALLDKRSFHDQLTSKPGTIDSIRAAFRKVTASNAAIIKEIFNQYGFLNYDMVGKEGSTSFWLMVQHADNDVPFQLAVLQKMKIEVERKKADPGNFAYLTDRVNVNTGKLQIFGTQLSRALAADGTQIPKPMIDPENVNKRRREIGLEPIEDYLKFARDAFKQHN